MWAVIDEAYVGSMGTLPRRRWGLLVTHVLIIAGSMLLQTYDMYFKKKYGKPVPKVGNKINTSKLATMLLALSLFGYLFVSSEVAQSPLRLKLGKQFLSNLDKSYHSGFRLSNWVKLNNVASCATTPKETSFVKPLNHSNSGECLICVLLPET